MGAENETVVLLLRAALLWAPAPCGVVYVVEEADQFGFAYGTFPATPRKERSRSRSAGTASERSTFAWRRFLA